MEVQIQPILNPTEDYEVVKKYRLKRQAFSTNYLFEIDEKFIASSLLNIANSEGMIDINDIIPFFQNMTAREKAMSGVGTQFKKTENYEIWKRYINWEYDKIEKDLLNSGIDLNSEISLTFHFGAEKKYDIDSLSKCLIDSFAERFMGGDDSNVKSINMTIEPVNNCREGFIDITIKNI